MVEQGLKYVICFNGGLLESMPAIPLKLVLLYNWNYSTGSALDKDLAF